MNKYEYRTLSLHEGDLERDLNTIGDEGWEAISVSHRASGEHAFCVLKRVKAEPAEWVRVKAEPAEWVRAKPAYLDEEPEEQTATGCQDEMSGEWVQLDDEDDVDSSRDTFVPTHAPSENKS